MTYSTKSGRKPRLLLSLGDVKWCVAGCVSIYERYKEALQFDTGRH